MHPLSLKKAKVEPTIKCCGPTYAKQPLIAGKNLLKRNFIFVMYLSLKLHQMITYGEATFSKHSRSKFTSRPRR